MIFFQMMTIKVSIINMILQDIQCINQGGLEDGFFSFDYSSFDDCFLKYI